MMIEMMKEEAYRALMERQLTEMIDFLMENDRPFGIVCRLEFVTFDPPLPDEIAKNLKDLTLFMIAGYTFESFTIEGDQLSFEAGFGADNFGSIVSMPILAIVQILFDDTPISLNLASPRPYSLQEQQEEGIQSSLETFLNNPENRKFLKKS